MDESVSSSSLPTSLIGPGDPPPFETINRKGGAPVLLTCDHASRAVPKALKGLGLPEEALATHIAWDIGAAEVTRRLSELLDAPAVLAGYSRLVIDLNRPLDSTRRPGLIPEESDHIEIPANRGITEAEAEARIEAIFRPYHDAISEILDGFEARGAVPLYVAMHSFTPVMEGFQRPWHVGVCWEHDLSLPSPLIAALKENKELCVGDNEPYPVGRDTDYGIPVHGAGRGLPHAMVEIRQDQLESDEGCERWAGIVGQALTKVLSRRLDS